MDRRRVQTAVTGHADSELPVVLPTEAIELDQFRRAHIGEDYWCGTWLGGCGQQLFTKLYTDRACHFSHRPNAGESSLCVRKSSGVASADHLYIKHGILDWLAEQEIPATAVIPRDADGAVGGSVLFEGHDGDGLRVMLSDSTATPGSGLQDVSHLLLGPQMDLDPKILTRQGYAHRIDCVPDGTRRRIRVGTEHHGGTDWFDLSECTLTPWGLSNPKVEEIRKLRTTTRPIGVSVPKASAPAAPAPPVSDPQPAIDRAAVLADLQQAVTEGRHVTRLRHCLARAKDATRSGATAEENELMRQAADALLRLERGVGLPTLHVEQPTPRGRRTPKGARTPEARGRTRLLGQPIAPAVMPRSKRVPPQAGPSKSLTPVAGALRGALRKAARQQSTTSWAQLHDQLGNALPPLGPEEQVQVLILVDRDTSASEPLLSTLLAAGDFTAAPAFRKAAAELGLELPEDDTDLRDVLNADTQQLQHLWRHR